MRFTRVTAKSSLIITAAMVVLGVEQASAQSTPPVGAPFGRPSIGVQAFNACTVTDYATVAATALNITPAQLRADLVQGQSLGQIAASASVTLQSVTSAVQAARKVDIDQAVSDGVITQAEGAAMEATPAAPATAPANVTPVPRPFGGSDYSPA